MGRRGSRLADRDRPRAHGESAAGEIEGQSAGLSAISVADPDEGGASAAVLRYRLGDDPPAADVGEDRALLNRIAAADRYEVAGGPACHGDAGAEADEEHRQHPRFTAELHRLVS